MLIMKKNDVAHWKVKGYGLRAAQKLVRENKNLCLQKELANSKPDLLKYEDKYWLEKKFSKAMIRDLKRQIQEKEIIGIKKNITVKGNYYASALQSFGNNPVDKSFFVNLGFGKRKSYELAALCNRVKAEEPLPLPKIDSAERTISNAIEQSREQAKINEVEQFQPSA